MTFHQCLLKFYDKNTFRFSKTKIRDLSNFIKFNFDKRFPKEKTAYTQSIEADGVYQVRDYPVWYGRFIEKRIEIVALKLQKKELPQIKETLKGLKGKIRKPIQKPLYSAKPKK